MPIVVGTVLEDTTTAVTRRRLRHPIRCGVVDDVRVEDGHLATELAQLGVELEHHNWTMEHDHH